MAMPDQAVEVHGGPVKTVARMREKLAEYASDGAAWPLCANILDPVRASIVCAGPTEVLKVVRWFVDEGGGQMGLRLCRIKNKFGLDPSELVGGYRDVMVCVLFTNSFGLKIIGEIQVHDRELYNLKLKMHRLYRILRANAADSI